MHLPLRRTGLTVGVVAALALVAVLVLPVPLDGAGVRTAHAATGGFVGLTPDRLLDTRSGIGAPVGKVGPNGVIDVQVTGRSGVPTTGVSAVVLNVTATEPTSSSFVTAYPTGSARPTASNLNFVAGQTVPNLVIVKVGTGGKVSLFNLAGATHLVADVSGYYTTTSQLTPVVPTRLLDTRDGTGGVQGPTSGEVSVAVAGKVGVPLGATSVVLNVTVTEPTADTFLTVWPSGIARPTASNLNVAAGRTVPNLVIARLGSDGRISYFNNAGSVHVVMDVLGYVVQPASTTADFTALNPVRLLDTRDGTGGTTGREPAGGAFDLQVLGRGGVPLTGVGAVALNLTVTEPDAPGFITVSPSGVARPTASNVNFVAGQTVPNLVIVPVGANGRINLYNYGGHTHLIADVLGWYPGTANSVPTIQLYLNMLSSAQITETGVLDAATTAAIGRFQTANGLVATGQPDQTTLETLVARAGSRSLLVDGCGGRTGSAPAQLYLNCSLSMGLVDVRWQSWTGQHGLGTGRVFERDCDAGCINGTPTYSDVTVEAIAPQRRRCGSSAPFQVFTLVLTEADGTRWGVFTPDSSSPTC